MNLYIYNKLYDLPAAVTIRGIPCNKPCNKHLLLSSFIMDNSDNYNNNNNNNNNNKDNDDNNLMVIDEGQDQEQSLLIKKRKVSNDEAFKAKTDATLRLIGSKIPGYEQDPLTRNKICKKANIVPFVSEICKTSACYSSYIGVI